MSQIAIALGYIVALLGRTPALLLELLDHAILPHMSPYPQGELVEVVELLFKLGAAIARSAPERDARDVLRQLLDEQPWLERPPPAEPPVVRFPVGDIATWSDQRLLKELVELERYQPIAEGVRRGVALALEAGYADWKRRGHGRAPVLAMVQLAPMPYGPIEEPPALHTAPSPAADRASSGRMTHPLFSPFGANDPLGATGMADLSRAQTDYLLERATDLQRMACFESPGKPRYEPLATSSPLFRELWLLEEELQKRGAFERKAPPVGPGDYPMQNKPPEGGWGAPYSMGMWPSGHELPPPDAPGQRARGGRVTTPLPCPFEEDPDLVKSRHLARHLGRDALMDVALALQDEVCDDPDTGRRREPLMVRSDPRYCELWLYEEELQRRGCFGAAEPRHGNWNWRMQMQPFRDAPPPAPVRHVPLTDARLAKRLTQPLPAPPMDDVPLYDAAPSSLGDAELMERTRYHQQPFFCDGVPRVHVPQTPLQWGANLHYLRLWYFEEECQRRGFIAPAQEPASEPPKRGLRALLHGRWRDTAIAADGRVMVLVDPDRLLAYERIIAKLGADMIGPDPWPHAEMVEWLRHELDKLGPFEASG